MATLLWAGMLADINQYLAAQGHAYAGFIDPTLYDQNSATPAPFHDITTGGSDVFAAPGWDPVTGWGSPDAWNLAQVMTRENGYGSKPQVYTTSSQRQYTLTGSDGSTWVDLDSTNLSLTFTPSSSCQAIISGNADLFTDTAGHNQDLRVVISGGSYPTWTQVAWKESGGAAAYSPHPIYVQGTMSLTAGTQYTIRLQWKANAQDSATIWAGAGPINTLYSPTVLTAICSSGSTVLSSTSTQQYLLAGSNGSTWVDLDPSRLALTFTPATSCSAVLTGDADLWTSQAGYNQDLSISVSGGAYNGIVAWEESGGASAYSATAVAVHTLIGLTGGTTYTIKLQWKTNTADSGQIWDGAGSSAPFSPTGLTLWCLPSSIYPATAVSTQQYSLTGSNGTTWVDMDATNLTLNVLTETNCMGVVYAGSDLWTSSASYNQDLGIFVSGGTYGSGAIESWRESGGQSGNFLPDAAFAALPRPFLAGTTYTIKLQWKANGADSGSIVAGAGSSAPFSPTRLTLLCLPLQ